VNPQAGGPPAPPPRGRRLGLVIGVIAAVVVLFAGGVTVALLAGAGVLRGLTWEIHDVRQVDDTLAEASVTVWTTESPVVGRWAIVREADGWRVCGPVEYLTRT
jgi:hypothetical protein